MRKFIAAAFSLILGIVLGVVAVALALWVMLALYRVEEASGWVLWALERTPMPLTAAPMQLTNDAIQRDTLIAAGLAAAVLCLFALTSLRSARRALRPAHVSHDGKGQVEFRARSLRVGRPVEGSIWLARDTEPGETFKVELSCKRNHGSGENETNETAFWEHLEVPAVRSPVGWSIPFRFDVPLIAPPSSADSLINGPGYRWRLAFVRSKARLSFPSVFALELGAAPHEELRAIERRVTPEQMEAIVGNAVSRQSSVVTDTVRREPILHERASLQALPPADPVLARKIPVMPGKIVKWLLIVLFGVPIGITAVAFATAVLLALIHRG
jgi:hypothetical protein